MSFTIIVFDEIFEKQKCKASHISQHRHLKLNGLLTAIDIHEKRVRSI